MTEIQLPRWFEAEMDRVCADVAEGRMTKKQANRLIVALISTDADLAAAVIDEQITKQATRLRPEDFTSGSSAIN